MNSPNWIKLKSSYAAKFKRGISPERNLIAAAVDLHERMEKPLFTNVPAYATAAAAMADAALPVGSLFRVFDTSPLHVKA